MTINCLIEAYAKINLFLHIVGKNPDSYHLLESVFAFTEVKDVITIEPANKLSISFSNESISETKNTVYKAAALLAEHLKKKARFSIKIEKKIPIAAGIGGSSADAAAVLKYLCNIWNVKMTREIYDIALKVGADVPACLHSKASLVQGIGEKITPINNFPQLMAVLINPGIEVSTKEIFKRFSGNFTKSNKTPITQKNVFDIIRNSKNDLQQVAESFCPEITKVISQIKEQDGCFVARMSGSGPTCFGLFKNREMANKALVSLSKKFSWSQLTALN
ncbi:MAG: 4-(cytidine 5'-diphospho)-2-C-methyl-D-erythritol kinase [Rickettsiaceae bacterium H1]|nr:4-(cytidine 5'-diphospho)-2-C-methyl-D-erythritol kinase [Rickettsiaceae bacterium H1]